MVAAERPDCLQEGLSLGFAAGCTGILPGFFRAHDQLKSLTLAEKMQRWANIQRTARIMVNPMATFAACGFAFAAAQCASYHNLGREDTLNGVVGGLAVGAVIGLKRASLASAIGYGSMFAGASLVSDFYTKVAHPALDDIELVGQRPAAASKA